MKTVDLTEKEIETVTTAILDKFYDDYNTFKMIIGRIEEEAEEYRKLDQYNDLIGIQREMDRLYFVFQKIDPNNDALIMMRAREDECFEERVKIDTKYIGM